MAQKENSKIITIEIESKIVKCAEYDKITYEEKKDGTKIYKKVPTSI
jgi:hypothetical protein